jgi:hypothetical protein
MMRKKISHYATLESWHALYNDYLSSGRSAQDFCESLPISVATFFRRLKQYGSPELADRSSSAVKPDHPTFIEIDALSASPVESSPSESMEISYPWGTTLRLGVGAVPLEVLVTLIRLGKEEPCSH